MFSSHDIIQQAVEGIAREADGNGVTKEQVHFERGHVAAHECWWIVTCESIVHHERGSTPGRPALPRLTWLDNPAQLDQHVKAYAAQLQKNPAFGKEPLQALSQRSDLGFDTTQSPILVPSTQRTIAYKRQCPQCNGAKQTVCGTCKSQGAVPCMPCRGQGSRSCSSCLGTGQRKLDDAYHHPDLLHTCPDCKKGRIQCDTCKGEGHLTCTRCKGRSGAPCGTCEGHGAFTDWATVACAGKLSGTMHWGDVPQVHRKAFHKLGIANLLYGHAEINRTKTERLDQTHHQITFHIKLPVGEVTTDVNGQPFTFDIIGLKAKTVARQPFLETLASAGSDWLEKAATGPVRLAPKRLRNAMQFDIVRDALNSVCWGGLDPGPFQHQYPRLDIKKTYWWLSTAQEALTKVLRHHASRWRWIWLALSFFVLLGWFLLDLRDGLGATPDAFFGADFLIILALPLLAFPWIRWRQKRCLQRIWHACRPNPGSKFKSFNYGVGFSYPPVGLWKFLLGFLLILMAVLGIWLAGRQL